MNVNSNTWNKVRYTIYSPFYDFIGGYFNASRKKSIDSLEIKAGEKVLLIGAGTGLDLEFLPDDCHITITDITESMLGKVRNRNKRLKKDVRIINMDGQNLSFGDESYDKVILHLILAVIPDPVACINEAERVLRKGGKLSVFDKFVQEDKNPGILRKFVNLFTGFLFSDITRKFSTIRQSCKLKLIADKEADFNGNFRIILLEKS
ncbi:MAG TPA: class I SAM-dependent methyltransferase [Bacteroidia bacterium]|nr:class I SAM-dependent methyltransferase [Bacteroidia bacterium]HNS11789.1 class I SAM-dependent methyltransferase [Bacteroidia bacterium]